MRICIYSPDPDKDFSTDAGTTCAFYFYPTVERWTDLDVMIDFIIKGRRAYAAEQGEQP